MKARSFSLNYIEIDLYFNSFSFVCASNTIYVFERVDALLVGHVSLNAFLLFKVLQIP